MKGTVKFYHDEKRFGFINGEDNKEYFVHFSGLAEGVTIKENDKVVFEVVEGDRGPKADGVKLDTGDSTEESVEEADEE